MATCLLALFRPTSLLASGVASLQENLHAASLEILVDDRLRGSGWLAGPDGLAFTAAHTLHGAHTIEVVSPLEGRLQARLVAKDLSFDLALIKVERPGGFFPYLPLAAAEPQPGDALFAFGTALNRHGVMTRGWLSLNGPHYEWNEVNRCYTEVQLISAMTPEGMSGSPWSNERGEVVGSQSGMMVWERSLMGFSFATPGYAIQHLLGTKQSASPISLGGVFAEVWESSVPLQGKPRGLVVTRLEPAGPMAKAGVMPGDLLLKIGGHQFDYRDELLRYVRGLSEGSEVPLLVHRQNGPELELLVKVLSRKAF